MLQTKLYPEDNILICDVVLARRPLSHTRSVLILICVLPARKQLSLLVLGDVNGVIGKTMHNLALPYYDNSSNSSDSGTHSALA